MREGFRRQDVFTRPANTTAYAANDVIAATTSDTGTTPLRGVLLGDVANLAFWLVYLRLDTDLDTFTPTVRIHFYNTDQPGTAVNGDNAAYTKVYANVDEYLGFADFPALADVGDHASATNDTVRLQLLPKSGSTLVYYRLEIISGTPTPGSAQSFTLTFGTA